MEVNKIYVGDWVKVAETLPSGIAHLIITSPPYWGQRNYGVDGQLGLEKTPEEHIEKLVLGFRELRRVLRDDGVVFLNYGDKYAGSGQGPSNSMSKPHQHLQEVFGKHIPDRLKQGDLIGLAWRLALALQKDGWILRSDIIWAKALSFCEKYSGSTMPESINGWRWERHRVKVKSAFAGEIRNIGARSRGQPENREHGGHLGLKLKTEWKPCPGCAKCAPDGLILRKGSWRPTRAHEYLFLLAKTSNYYADMEAVREAQTESTLQRCKYGFGEKKRGGGTFEEHGKGEKKGGFHDYQIQRGEYINPSGRNLRDVFCINPQAYPDSHYATFPEKLVEPCIKVGTSEKGCCPKCGAQWARIIDNKPMIIKRSNRGEKIFGDKHSTAASGTMVSSAETTTLGWLPTCKCGIKETIPAVVLDPFCGTATVCAVAAKLGRNYIGIELNPDYVKNQAEYRVAEGETGISKEEQKAGQIPLFPMENQ